MKKKFLLLPVLAFLFLSATIHAQSVSPGQAVAEKIATKMKDSLSLTTQEKESILTVNMQLHTLKMQVHSQYTNTDSVQANIQHVEYSRDSLYKAVLPDAKYQLYLQKRATLINNN